MPSSLAGESVLEQGHMTVKVHNNSSNLCFISQAGLTGASAGADGTVNAISRSLKWLINRMNNRIGNVLYLLDNTSGDNKNRYVMAFLAFLVHIRVFEKVKVSFMEVGHTHEDIDQFFSVIANNVRTMGALAWRSFVSALTGVAKEVGRKDEKVRSKLRTSEVPYVELCHVRRNWVEVCDRHKSLT